MQTTFKTRLRYKDTAGPDQTKLRFEADYDDDANSEWAKYTPGLAFECTIKDEIADRWQIGTAYTFTAEESGVS